MRQLRRPATWSLALLFAGLGFLAMQLIGGAIDSLRIVMLGENQQFDSPYFIQLIISAVSFVGLPVTAWLFGNAIHQETAHRTEALLWSTPLAQRSFWFGRWGAALVINLGLFLTIAAGIWISVQMPWLDADQFGAGRLAGYLYPYLITVFPRTLLAGTLVFVLVARSRSMLAGYFAIVAMMGLYNTAARLASDLENRTVAAFLDPSGGVAYDLATRYWTTAQKNTELVPLAGLFLSNRLLWTGLAIGLLLAGTAGLRLDLTRSPKSSWRWLGQPRRLLSVVAQRSKVHGWSQRMPLWIKATLSEYFSVVSHPVFLITVAITGLVLLGSAASLDQLYGTTTWPVTYAVAENLGSLFGFFGRGILLFFCGHVMWRERSTRMAPLFDSTPRKVWHSLATKLGALLAVAATLQLLVLSAGLIYQSHKGYSRFELELYASQLFGLQLADLALFVALAMFVQALLASRWLAYLATVLIYFGGVYAPAIGVDHLLARFGSDPGVTYSELNGYGHFLLGWSSTKFLWAILAVLMLVASGMLWSRGEPRGWQQRWQRGRRRLSGRLATVSCGLVLLWPLTGSWVYYNTNVLNRYQGRAEVEKIQVEAERDYRQWLDRATPKILKIETAVDLYPTQRSAKARSRYQLRNQATTPIEAFLLRLPNSLKVESLELDRPYSLGPRDLRAGYQEVRFDSPLAAGQQFTLEISVRLDRRGFGNRQTGQLGLARNGTFLTSGQLLPGIGYSPDSELLEPSRRRRFGLETRDPLPPRGDPRARTTHLLSGDADFVEFEAVVSTELEQTALAPGDQVSTWVSEQRRYFKYRTAQPVLPMFVFVSGDYEVLRDRWQEVDLEIYFDPDHRYNVDTMMRGLKRSLALYSEAFGPYPHRTLRIVEFPRYSRFAMSLPTLIPFSESIGFIARLDDPQAIDYPFYVTAHEVAHQWWPHQVAAAATEGAPFLSETLSQYSALRVMAEQYGAERMGRFLRYELDRYLAGRGLSRLSERPLSRIQTGQPHLHYNKGALAIWSLADRMGFERMDGVLAEYLRRYGGQGPPYPTTADFFDLLRDRLDPSHHSLMDDLFERMTFYDLETRVAECSELGNGSYRVSLQVKAAKNYADGDGNLSPTQLNDSIEIGVFGEKRVLRKKVPKQLALERHLLVEGLQNVELEVPSLPTRAGIDPYFKVVDQDPFDNVQELKCKPAPVEPARQETAG